MLIDEGTVEQMRAMFAGIGSGELSVEQRDDGHVRAVMQWPSAEKPEWLCASEFTPDELATYIAYAPDHLVTHWRRHVQVQETKYAKWLAEGRPE